MAERQEIKVMIEDRPDGGVRVWSNDLPGLILSGQNRMKILAAIEPAARALLEFNGIEKPDFVINATLIARPLNAP